MIRVNLTYRYLVLLLILCGVTGFLPDRLLADSSNSVCRISGVVLDEDTGGPVSSVHVRIVEMDLWTITDQQGMFLFPNLHAGSYHLECSHVAYETCERAFTVHEGFPLRLVLSLTPRILQGEPVEFEVSGYAPQAAGSLVISREELERSNWHDAGDAIRTLPGIQVTEESVQGKKTVSIRGCRPDHVIVYLDDVPLNSGSGDAVDLGTLPLNAIERIVVNPYGADHEGALGGEVRLYSRGSNHHLPIETNVTATAEVTSERESDLSGSLDIQHGNWNGSVIVQSRSSKGDFEYTSESGEERSRWNNYSKRLNGMAMVNNHLSENWRIRFSLVFDNTRNGSPGVLFQAPTPDAYHKDSYLRGQYQLTRFYAFGELSSSVFAAQRERMYLSPEYQYNPDISQWIYQVPVHLTDESTQYGASLLWRVDPEEESGLSYSFQVGMRNETFSSENQLPSGTVQDRLDGEINRRTGWIGGHSSYGLDVAGAQTSTELSARLTYLNDSYTDASHDSLEKQISKPTWSFCFTFEPPELLPTVEWTLSARYQESFSPPPFTSVFLAESVFSRGNFHLQPERSRSFYAGAGISVDGNLLKMSSSAEMYHRSTYDLIIWRANYRQQYYPDNLGKATIDGIDLALQIEDQQQMITTGGTLSLQDAKNDDHSSPYYNNRIPFQPEWYGSSFVHLQFEPYRISIECRFSGRRYTTESNLDPYSHSGGGLEPYVVMDGYLERTFTFSSVQLDLVTGITNITNKAYELVDRMPMPPRTYYATCTIRY